MDPHFTVEVISQTPNPQQTIWLAAHQDYSEHFVSDENPPPELECGGSIVRNLLKGGRGHYGCYSDDTEVLTISGWKSWPKVSTLDKLLAVNIEANTCHFETPSALQQFDIVSGDKLYHLNSQYLNFSVTLDHRMVVSHRQKSGDFSGWYFKSASDVMGKPVRYLLNSCLDKFDRTVSELPKNIDPLVAFKVAGFFFWDGVRSRNVNPQSIRFRIRCPKKIAYLLSIGIPSTVNKGDRYTIKHEELAAWVHKWFSGPSGKVVPNWLITLPMEMVAAFWDGLKNSDGTRITKKSWCYDSCEKEALDTIQAVAHVNGFSANMTLNSPNDGVGQENHRPCWRLCISEHSTRRVETCHGRSPGISEELAEYSGKVYCATVSTGALMVRRRNKVFVSGNCLEHPQIVLNCGWLPHSTMQQIRTHRVGVSFDVQSFRYTGSRIAILGKTFQLMNDLWASDVEHALYGECGEWSKELAEEVENVFYLRPVGEYSDRQGKKYTYTVEQRREDTILAATAATHYKTRIDQGFSEEHARGLIPFDVRQHWVMSANVRSLMHLLDLRWKADAQLECQQLCDLIWPHFQNWVPDIAAWYETNRAKKARLAP